MIGRCPLRRSRNALRPPRFDLGGLFDVLFVAGMCRNGTTWMPTLIICDRTTEFSSALLSRAVRRLLERKVGGPLELVAGALFRFLRRPDRRVGRVRRNRACRSERCTGHRRQPAAAWGRAFVGLDSWLQVASVLRRYLLAHRMRTARDGDVLLFRRTATEPFAPNHVRRRALETWAAANERREREGLPASNRSAPTRHGTRSSAHARRWHLAVREWRLVGALVDLPGRPLPSPPRSAAGERGR